MRSILAYMKTILASLFCAALFAPPAQECVAHQLNPNPTLIVFPGPTPGGPDYSTVKVKDVGRKNGICGSSPCTWDLEVTLCCTTASVTSYHWAGLGVDHVFNRPSGGWPLNGDPKLIDELAACGTSNTVDITMTIDYGPYQYDDTHSVTFICGACPAS